MSQTHQVRRLTAEQEPFLIVRSFATNYPTGYVIESHAHDWHQLLYAITGAMTVFAGQSSWMIPPGQAVLIPAHYRHSIRMWGSVAMRSAYFPVRLEAAALAAPECRVISVTPLLRELVLRVVELSALDSRVPADARFAAVMLDEMAAAPVTPLALLLPVDPRALVVARYILDAPGTTETIDELARRHAVGSRTLERLFRCETGMSVGLWRQKARMLASIRVLVETRSVTDAALQAGYESLSAFISAFKRTFGITPGAMLAGDQLAVSDSPSS